MTRCVRLPCIRQAEVRVVQSYKDGAKVGLRLCRVCARRWLRQRPNTSKEVPYDPRS
jgi:hypothetical protein